MPTPDTTTYKVWVEYTYGTLQHELLLRFVNNPASDTNTLTKINNIITTMLDCMSSNDGVTGARYATPGAAFSLPLTGVTVDVGTLTPGTVTQENLATFAGISARSLLGVNTAFHLFCQAAVPFNEYRIAIGSVPSPLVDWYNEMDAITPRRLVAIDGQDLNLKGYMNFGQNAYWQRRQR